MSFSPSPPAASTTASPSLASRIAWACTFYLCVYLAIQFYHSDQFATELQPTEQIHKLEVLMLEQDKSDSANSTSSTQLIPTPYSWPINGDATLKSRRFAVQLPAHYSLPGHILYFSAYQIAIEVYFNGKIVAQAGDKYRDWYRPLKPLTLDLSPLQFSDGAGQRALTIEFEVFGNKAKQGGFGSVWYGSQGDILASRSFFVDLLPKVQLANISVLCALLLFLGIDSVLSRSSRSLFVLAIPSLCYAVLCLPVMSLLDTVIWAKLFQTSILSMYAFGIYIGVTVMGISDRLIGTLVSLMMATSLPFIFIQELESLRYWLDYFVFPITGVLGLVTFSYVVWKLPDSNNKPVACIYFFAGIILCSAGVSDILQFSTLNPEYQLLVFPFAALNTTLVIFLWTALDMLQRNFHLLKNEARMRQMISSRTSALQEARSELMQHQRYKALNTMGAAISHEIKNPLGSLGTDIEVLGLKLKTVAPQVNSILHRMRRTAQRIDNIITDLSDFSRKITINKVRLDLAPWLEENLREPEFQALLEAVNLQLGNHAHISPKFDPEQLRRALLNIVENATLAVADHPSPRIELSTERQGEYFIFRVKDNGGGFNPVDIHRLCEPMVSGRNTGMGLGLSVARDILVLHEGELILENAIDGQGAIVTMRVPVD